ncbi:hypothetical protein MOQ26_22900, partial [Stenotrophomonas maltophilia]|nr:hypothetical protein [Stenotrophomonas maltophilia]
DVWNNVSAIQKAFIIGGGAVILKRYITDINRSEIGHKYPLEFFPANESVWMIVQSYMKILKFYLAQKQSV